MNRKRRRIKSQKSHVGRRRIGIYVGRRILIGLVVAVVLLLGITALRLVWDYHQFKLDRKEPFQIVAIGRVENQVASIKLMQYQPFGGGKLVVINIPKNLWVKTSNFGDLRMDSLYTLAKVEKQEEEFIRHMLQRILGRHIQVVVTFDQVQGSTDYDRMRVVRELLVKGLKGGHNSYAMMRAALGIMSVGESRLNIYDLSGYIVYEEITDVDGQQRRILSERMLDRVINDVIQVEVPLWRQITVSVVNTTDLSGLASRWSRLLTNEGFTVVNETSAQMDLANSRLLIREFGLIDITDYQKVQEMLGWLPVEVNSELTGQYRSDVVIELAGDSE